MLTHKQRALLYTIEQLNIKGNSSKFMLMKDLFILSVEENMNKIIKFYNFFPYHYGPFSNTCYIDLNKLQSEDLIKFNGNSLELTEKGNEAAKTVDKKAAWRITSVVERFNSNKQIREYVYGKYPEYTVKSKLVKNINYNQPPGLYTIGYEGRDIDKFLDILIQNDINILIDVRKNPFSMKFSFIKKKLKTYLEKVEIQYIHIPELGIDGEDRKHLSKLSDYNKLFEVYKKTTLKLNYEKLDYIFDLSTNNRIAMMCFEASIDMCHRGVIAKEIESNKGIEVVDI